MVSRDIQKNSREVVRVSTGQYMGHDLINIRTYAPSPGGDDLVPTRRGIAVNIDLVPDLVSALLWALRQPCDGDQDGRELSADDEEKLVLRAHHALLKHGIAIHWDSIERLVLDDGDMARFSKWDLHYVLVRRDELFESIGNGCFKARILQSD